MKFVAVLIIVLLFNLSFLSAQTIDEYKSLQIIFEQDTALIEQKVRDMLDEDYSTIGMITATGEREKGYDILLNKYYNLLRTSLDPKGQQKLKEAQRNWIKSRDSDKELILALYANAYQKAEGGTIWGIIASEARAEVTRQRVFVLYKYLMFGYLGGS